MSTAGLDPLYVQHLQTLMQRADRALEACGFDALVIHAGAPLRQFLDDQDYPFKVNPHFKAWVPVLDNPHSVLVYEPGRRPRLLFHRPYDFWHKPAELPDEPWAESLDVTPLADPADAAKYWENLARPALLGPPDAFATADSSTLNDPDLVYELHYQRAVKTPYELECLRRANVIGVRGHRAAQAAFQRGASEFEVQMRYLEACGQREEEMPYNNIVAYNENAAVLHYQHLERRTPSPLRSFLIDAGAQYRGYAADITRTYATAAGRFAELIELMDGAQRRLCGTIVAGLDYREVHLLAHAYLGEVMQQIGLIKIDGDAAIDAGITRVFFPHGIGHLLGLQVHDVGGVMGDLKGVERQRPEGHPYLRLTRMLEPGVVVTVEPGIYFIDSLLAAAKTSPAQSLIDWAVVEELRPFGGVRIEDDVVTTTSTPENLTRDAFSA